MRPLFVPQQIARKSWADVTWTETGRNTAIAAQASDSLSTWGNITSIVGLFASVAGFVWALVQIYRSKNAAQQARDAADRAREDIFRSSAMLELAAALAAMQEIQRLQREGAWRVLLEKYSALRTNLISIRAGRPNLNEQHKSTIQGAIAQLRTIEDKVQRALVSDQTPKIDKLNSIVADQLDKLSEVLGALRSRDDG